MNDKLTIDECAHPDALVEKCQFNDELRREITRKLNAIQLDASTVGAALGRLQSHEGRMVKAEIKLKAIGWAMLFVLFMGALLTIAVGSHQGWLPVVPVLQKHQIFEEHK